MAKGKLAQKEEGTGRKGQNHLTADQRDLKKRENNCSIVVA